MSNHEQPQNPDFDTWLTTVLRQAHEIGYTRGRADGFEQGVVVGYCLALEHTRAAVSDGLRHGSVECGRNMRSRRKT